MSNKHITTVAELAAVYGGGVITNDRGQGDEGPGYIPEDCLDSTDVLSEVTEEEDPGAWKLAREAAKDLGLPEPTVVCVGVRGDGSNPHQWVYAV